MRAAMSAFCAPLPRNAGRVPPIPSQPTPLLEEERGSARDVVSGAREEERPAGPSDDAAEEAAPGRNPERLSDHRAERVAVGRLLHGELGRDRRGAGATSRRNFIHAYPAV